MRSSALQADSYHFATDAVGKVGVLVGVGMAYLGYPFMDLVGAVAIAITFLAAAYILGKRNLRVLADASPDPILMERLRAVALGVPGVAQVHSLRGRVSGPGVLVDLVIHVPSNLTLEEAHGTAHRVEETLKRQIPEVSEVIIHVEPWPHDARLDASHAE